jgi:putative DNA primase/helicase
LPTIHGVPESLRSLHAWVVWRYESRRDKSGERKRTKVPYNVHTVGLDNGKPRRAKSNDSATWASFDQALQALGCGGFDGIGLVMAHDLNGWDFDHCRDSETGAIDEWAGRGIDALSGYSEVSPSGTGIHVIARASLPPGGRKVSIPGAREGAKVECYDRTSPDTCA